MFHTKWRIKGQLLSRRGSKSCFVLGKGRTSFPNAAKRTWYEILDWDDTFELNPLKITPTNLGWSEYLIDWSITKFSISSTELKGFGSNS